MTATRLFLVRHGETTSNAEGGWQGGRGDDSLNERGRAQSLATADFLRERLPLDVVYSSNLRRAAETAAIIGTKLHLPVETHSGLCEYFIGKAEGAGTVEVLAKWQALLSQWRSDPTIRPPDGESAIDFTTRVGGALQEIIRKHQGGRIVVVAHGGSLSVGIAILLRQPERWRDFQMSNGAVTTIIMDPDPKMIEFNDISHLEGIGTAAWMDQMHGNSDSSRYSR